MKKKITVKTYIPRPDGTEVLYESLSAQEKDAYCKKKKKEIENTLQRYFNEEPGRYERFMEALNTPYEEQVIT